jgi:hypothetical protein
MPLTTLKLCNLLKICWAKLQFLDSASGEKGCEISTYNFHIQQVVKKAMVLELSQKCFSDKRLHHKE